MSGVHLEGGNALKDWVLGRTSTDLDFLRSSESDWSTERRGGSANLDMIANAAALVWAQGADVALWVESWRAFFEQERRTFQRGEPWSVIYSGWHLLPVLVVFAWAGRNGVDDLAAAARRWLLNWWCLSGLGFAWQGGNPFSVLTGARSSGVPIGAFYSHRAAWCEAFGWPWSRCDPSDAVNGWCDYVVVGLREEILATSESVISALKAGNFEVIADLAPGFGMRGGGNIYRTAAGVACWLERDVNGNTAGVLACSVEAPDLAATLPPNGGPYFRRAFSEATCERRDDVLVYSSPHPELGSHSLRLPPGEPLYHLRIDEAGWHWLVGGASEPAPPPQPQPLPPLRPIHKSQRKSNDTAKIAAGAVGLIALLVNLFTRKKEKP